MPTTTMTPRTVAHRARGDHRRGGGGGSSACSWVVSSSMVTEAPTGWWRFSLPRGRAAATATRGPGGARMSAVASRDPFQPVIGDDIGPTTGQRVRSGVVLGLTLLVLGLLAALALGFALVV